MARSRLLTANCRVCSFECRERQGALPPFQGSGWAVDAQFASFPVDMNVCSDFGHAQWQLHFHSIPGNQRLRRRRKKPIYRRFGFVACYSGASFSGPSSHRAADCWEPRVNTLRGAPVCLLTCAVLVALVDSESSVFAFLITVFTPSSLLYQSWCRCQMTRVTISLSLSLSLCGCVCVWWRVANVRPPCVIIPAQSSVALHCLSPWPWCLYATECLFLYLSALSTDHSHWADPLLRYLGPRPESSVTYIPRHWALVLKWINERERERER